MDECKKLGLFEDVESREKQAAALRRLATMIEAGEVFAVLSVVVARRDDEGTVSEASDWRDVDHPEMVDPEKRAYVGFIMMDCVGRWAAEVDGAT